MSFVRKTREVPNIREGDVIEAEVVDVDYPIQGKFGEQIELYVRLDNGYEARVWIPYYKRPSDRSFLGQFCLKVTEALGEEHESVDETLNALVSRIGKVLLRCVGFREYQGAKYPKLKIVPDKLPDFQGKVEKIKKDVLQCKGCAESIPSNSRFCPNCGTKL